MKPFEKVFPLSHLRFQILVSIPIFGINFSKGFTDFPVSLKNFFPLRSKWKSRVLKSSRNHLIRSLMIKKHEAHPHALRPRLPNMKQTYEMGDARRWKANPGMLVLYWWFGCFANLILIIHKNLEAKGETTLKLDFRWRVFACIAGVKWN